ncbi:MAG: glycoside hydrolase family 43, partial [Chitinophagaceae bacterium]
EYAVDNNNGTLWKPKNNTSEAWISIDLGAVKNVKSIHTQFEYATWYYQYTVESSVNGTDWTMFADRSKNNTHGSPLVDVGNASARYIRLKVLNTEYPGLNKAVWNIKVYDNASYIPVPNTVPGKLVEMRTAKGLVVDLNAENLKLGSVISSWENTGSLKGKFEPEGAKKPIVDIIEGRKAVIFSGNTSLESDFVAPSTLSGNSSFSVSMWLYNPEIQSEEPILSWTERGGVDITNATFGYGHHRQWGAAAHWGWPDMSFKRVPEAKKWHHIAFTFDGTYEKIYVDGALDKQDLKMLFLANLRNFVIGTTSDKNAYFSGALASLKVFDTALSPEDVEQQASSKNTSNVAVYLDAARLPYGELMQWKNEGFELSAFTSTVNSPLVGDVDGKIALQFAGNNRGPIGKAHHIHAFGKRGYGNRNVHGSGCGLLRWNGQHLAAQQVQH